jgi:putative FmdB family regulatory protein
MPFYEYECTECGNRFEKVRSIEGRYGAICPECGGLPQLLVSLSSIRFELPATIRYHDGRIFAQRPNGGKLPPPAPPTPEQRDREIWLRDQREKEAALKAGG